MPLATEKPQWAPRVPQSQIRRLYETDAQGILVEALIDEVGWALWQRCDSILTVTAAHNGHVRCPRCGASIERPQPRSEEGELHCEGCGWQLPWLAYHQTYRGKQLFGANAVEDFTAYHAAFPQARSAREKMVLIDQLIHAFHIRNQDIGRPAAANLIEGSLREVVQFLDILSGSPSSASGMVDSQPAWRRTLDSAEWTRGLMDPGEGPEKNREG